MRARLKVVDTADKDDQVHGEESEESNDDEGGGGARCTISLYATNLNI